MMLLHRTGHYDHFYCPVNHSQLIIFLWLKCLTVTLESAADISVVLMNVVSMAEMSETPTSVVAVRKTPSSHAKLPLKANKNTLLLKI